MFSYDRLKDPAYFAENRMPAHSDHAFFESEAALRSGKSALRTTLNGVWKFHHALNNDQVIPGFESMDYDCRPWADIHVPAHIQMEGYGAPQYANTQYPWDGCQDVEIGEIPNEFNPVACYVRYFTLPEAMRGKRVFVSFQGAESCVAVWLNGRYVGFSSDSFTPSEFELTDFLKDGENKLACRVYRWCAGSWLEDQDFMRFSGLFRDVILYAVPETHLRDVRIKTLLDDDYQSAVLTVDAEVWANQPGWTMDMALTDGGVPVCQSPYGEAMKVAAPRLWSSEDPHLYDLTLTLKDADGQVSEVVRQKVGFRRFEIKDGVMCLNGVRIVFKGTNRHDYCAERGRAVTREGILRDLLIMKRNNINAVRTSHYPNSSALYELCDELGLYLIDETNMESHGVWDAIMRGQRTIDEALPGNRDDWRDILLDRVNSTFQRDKNHPSILIWSCGNESFGGDVIYDMSALFRQLDDTRLVHYEGVHHDRRRNETSDIESQMYTPVTKIREFLKEHRDKPFILCEYTHSMGNSNGAMHKYTEYAYEEPLYQGGFIWDFIDQSIRTKNRYGKTVYRYGGDFDDRPNDGNFSGNGIVYGNGQESPKMQEVKYNYQDIFADITEDSIVVRNRAMFTPTYAYDCAAILLRDGVEIDRVAMDVNVPPLSQASYPNPFAGQTEPGEYAVTLSFTLKQDTLWAKRGSEAAFGQGVYKVEAAKTPRESCPPLKVIRGYHNLGVRGDGFSVLFSHLSGGLVSFRNAGVEMLKTMPVPNFWRAPTDNDRGCAMPQRYAQWKIASMYLSHRATPELAMRNMAPEPTLHEDGSVSIAYTYGLPTTPAAECTLAWRVYPCGAVEGALSYDAVPGLGDMPEFGVMLRMDADYDRMRWYGLGPDENYVDRHQGARLGIFETTARENLSHYLVPQECGNRTGVRWAEVTNHLGRGLRFEGDNLEVSVLPWTPHELENALHEDELPEPQYTVVRVCKQQMGIAGDDSWGARTHDEYLLPTSNQLRFRMSAVNR